MSVAPKYLRDELTLLMLKAAAEAWVWICLRPFPVCHSPPPCFPVCFRCFPINKGRMPEMNVKKDSSETQIMVLVTITKSVIFLQISSKQTASLCYFMYANLTWLSHIGHNIRNWLKQIQMQSSEGKPWVVDFNVIFTLKHTTHPKLFGNQGSTHKTALPARILRNDLRRVKGTDPNITEHPKYTSEQACPMDTLPTALKSIRFQYPLSKITQGKFSEILCLCPTMSYLFC